MSTKASCAICGDLEEFSLTGKWADLRESARMGCLSCSLLLHGVVTLGIDHEAMMKFETNVDMSLFLMLMKMEEDRTPAVTVEFYTEKDRPVQWRKIGPARHVQKDVGNPDCIKLMRRWLHDCEYSHPKCKQPRLLPLPTRVIYVGASDRDVRLHISYPRQSIPYAALSHRWGDVHPLITTGSTIKARMKHIEFDQSSQLFAQAVQVTRSLGISYLWIDSLCIIQDSKADWTREASNMTNVYNNAMVTIFAHASADSSQTLFPDGVNRRQSSILSGSVPQAEGIFVRKCFNYPSEESQSYHTSETPQRSNLTDRGWILQEELLSPRSLHFHAEEVSWNCSSVSRCECQLRPNVALQSPFRDQPLPGPSPEQMMQLQQLGMVNPEIQAAIQKMEVLFVEWPDLVVDFTRRHLTNGSDFLPALSGLAGYIEKVCPSTMYYGGLWRGDVGFGLCWFRDHQYEAQHIKQLSEDSAIKRRKLERKVYRIRHKTSPSWSWASLPSHAAVSYYSRFDNSRSPKHFLKYNDDSIEELMDVQPYLKNMGTGVFVKTTDMYSWGEGLMGILCRRIFVKRVAVSESASSHDLSESKPPSGESQEASSTQASQSWNWEIVDKDGTPGGHRPQDLDLQRMDINLDFPIDDGHEPAWVPVKNISKNQVEIIEAEHDEKARQRLEQKRFIESMGRSASILDIFGDRTKEVRKWNTWDNSSSKTQDAASQVEAIKQTFALVLVGNLHWKHGTTPLPLEGVCLLLEPLVPEFEVYRRAGFVTGAGSLEAWVRDVPDQVIFVV